MTANISDISSILSCDNEIMEQMMSRLWNTTHVTYSLLEWESEMNQRSFVLMGLQLSLIWGSELLISKLQQLSLVTHITETGDTSGRSVAECCVGKKILRQHSPQKTKYLQKQQIYSFIWGKGLHKQLLRAAARKVRTKKTKQKLRQTPRNGCLQCAK